MTSKSIGVIYSLRASFVLSLATFKHRGQKILSGHCLIDQLTNWQLQNNMPPFLYIVAGTVIRCNVLWYHSPFLNIFLICTCNTFRYQLELFAMNINIFKLQYIFVQFLKLGRCNGRVSLWLSMLLTCIYTDQDSGSIFFYLDIIFSSIHSFLLLFVSGHFKQENAHTLNSWVAKYIGIHKETQLNSTHRQSHSCVTTQLNSTLLANRVHGYSVLIRLTVRLTQH